MSSIHRIRQFIQYRSKALSRHGVHSPFVYEFIEKVLYKSGTKDLKKALDDHYSSHNIRWNEWQLNGTISEETIIILENIHEDKQHTTRWESLAGDEQVRLSLDLFDYGLLFFKNDFIEKQHFVLKR